MSPLRPIAGQIVPQAEDPVETAAGVVDSNVDLVRDSPWGDADSNAGEDDVRPAPEKLLLANHVSTLTKPTVHVLRERVQTNVLTAVPNRNTSQHRPRKRIYLRPTD